MADWLVSWCIIRRRRMTLFHTKHLDKLEQRMWMPTSGSVSWSTQRYRIFDENSLELSRALANSNVTIVTTPSHTQHRSQIKSSMVLLSIQPSRSVSAEPGMSVNHEPVHFSQVATQTKHSESTNRVTRRLSSSALSSVDMNSIPLTYAVESNPKQEVDSQTSIWSTKWLKRLFLRSNNAVHCDLHCNGTIDDYTSTMGIDKSNNAEIVHAAQLVGDYRLHVCLLEGLVKCRDDALLQANKQTRPHTIVGLQPPMHLTTLSCLISSTKRLLNTLTASVPFETESPPQHSLPVPPMTCFQMIRDEKHSDVPSRSFSKAMLLQDHVKVCDSICEEIYATASQAIDQMKESYATKSQALQFYEVENSSRNGKDVDMLLGKIFLDLELFRCVHSDMKSNLYRRLPIELVPAAEKKTTGEAWEDTTTASSQNSTEDFSVFDYATKICDVSIQHNTGTYLSVKNAEVSLVPNFDARSCVFALCTHADNFPRDLKEPIQNGGGTLGEFVGEKASDHHHRLPDSRQIIELEHKAIVGFRHQASGKWLGRNVRIFGGNLVCENDAFGEEEEFEVSCGCFGLSRLQR